MRAPLLRLPPDISPLALECFDCILRYSMDLQMDGDITEVKCVYTILMVKYCSIGLFPYLISKYSYFSTVTNI